MAKGGIGESDGGVAMQEEMLLEETKLLMKLVEEALQMAGVGEVDEKERKEMEEKVRKAVKKLREKHISHVLV